VSRKLKLMQLLRARDSMKKRSTEEVSKLTNSRKQAIIKAMSRVISLEIYIGVLPCKIYTLALHLVNVLNKYH